MKRVALLIGSVALVTSLTMLVGACAGGDSAK